MARPLALLPLLLTLLGGALAQGIHPGDAVRVNGVPISNQRFNGFYVEYRNSKGVAVGARGDQLELLKRLRREALDRIIEQELVSQAAERDKVQVSAAEVEAAVAELKSVFEDPQGFEFRLQSEGFSDEQSYRRHVERMLAAKKYLDSVRASNATVGDEELEAYYRDNERRLTFPEQVRVRHILLTWKPMGTRDDRQAIRDQMAAILERARAGEDFALLAREFSDDSATRDGGGDTGLFHRGQMVPAFERVAFSLKPGEISDPVETVFGVHILRLEERRESRLVPLDEIREPLREHVSEENMARAVEQEIARLRAEANIEILIPVERKAASY
jgi:peptidyl-prolyl cis-trans isomerase C